VTAAFAAEAAEAGDNSPTLGQPVLYAEKAHAFVPFSIEIGQDWAGLQAELAKLIRDAKDVLESEKFLTGAGHGSNEPQGLLTGSTVVVTTATTAVYSYDDVYSLLQAVPARFQANTTWLSSNTILDSTWRFVPTGSTVNASIMDSRAGGVLGRRTRAWSDMTTATTSGSTIVAAGDINAGFVIGDRVGMTIELVPHLFGGNQRPTGERGVYAYFRTGSVVAVPQAIRCLKVL
jgi:HK97 family phage major capsid protein